MDETIYRNIVFWGIWLIIPLLIDIITGLISGIVTFIAYFKRKKIELEFLPTVSILIPVYNSEKTLKQCLSSITNQTYPIKNIEVLLLNNGEKDKSYEIYCEFQSENPFLKVWWIDSKSGKAKALNKGLYISNGKYIINIDSDGVLDKNAVRKIVEKFEGNTDIHAMTGVVLTDKNLIEEKSSLLMKLFRRCELFEYNEAFLVGRGFQSYFNSMFTLAGAFSCFRKDIILKTQLYNSETLGEDTHITSQVREFLNGRIALCEEAFFYVDPIESFDRLYIQRQRWQRGQIEVASLFRNLKKRKSKTKSILKRTVLKDHTLVFPRLIWIFAMVYLIFIDYPMELIVIANILMYLAYVINSIVSFCSAKLYLREQEEVSKYVSKHFYIVFLLPIYRMVVFFMRMAGIINSIEKHAKWNARTLSEERKIVRETIKSKFSLYYKVKGWINDEET